MIEWNVALHNPNNDELYLYNIFNHKCFRDGCKRVADESEGDFEVFQEKLDRQCLYCFWAKCEYELLIRGCPPSDQEREKKVDAYQQIKANWKRFSEYVWESKNAL